jgi:hypothetical protein
VRNLMLVGQAKRRAGVELAIAKATPHAVADTKAAQKLAA